MKISKKTKKLIIIAAVILFFGIIYHFFDAYELLGNPISSLRLGINLYDYSGSYDYDELNGNSKNVFVSVSDNRIFPAEHYSISLETSDEIEKLLSEYKFTMEHFDSEGKGNISMPENSIIIFRSEELSAPEFTSLGNGVYSYGIGSVAVLEDKVIVNKYHTKEHWFVKTGPSDEDIIVNTTITVSYSCKDPELVEKIHLILYDIVKKY